jgi:hypothetical protein
MACLPGLQALYTPPYHSIAGRFGQKRFPSPYKASLNNIEDFLRTS